MAKYEDLYPDTEEMVKELLKIIDEHNLITVKMRADNNQKDLIKLTKSNDLNKELGKYDVAITINQKIFNELPEPIQILSLDEALTALGYNDDAEKAQVIPPDVKTHSGFLNRYGYERFVMMNESIKATYDRIKQEEQEQKDAAKMGK